MSLSFEALVGALKVRFGDHHLQKIYHSELQRRQQPPGEYLQMLPAIIECLARRAFLRATVNTLNRVGTAAFEDAVSHPNVQTMSRLSRPTAVRTGPVDAMEITAVRRASCSRNLIYDVEARPRTAIPGFRNSNDAPRSRIQANAPCWRCGRRGHFSSECAAESQCESMLPRTKGNSSSSPLWRQWM